MQKSYIMPLFEKALQALGASSEGLFFEQPANPDHGDLSTNIAMKSAKALKKSPRAIAEDIIGALEYDKTLVEKVEIAGAGFINVKFTPAFTVHMLKEMRAQGARFGRSDYGKGQRVNVEYVSANPTGLLHLGHGRNAALGDTIANLYAMTGREVTREYYFNNAGNQMNMLAKSVNTRLRQTDDPAIEFPEDGYHGEYVKDIAAEIAEKYGNKYSDTAPESLEFCKKYGEQWCFAVIKKTLDSMNIRQDIFFNEDTLYSSGRIKELVDNLRAKDLAYDKDGAVWLAFTKLGLSDDRVIIKSTGEATYRLPDIAYHIDKLGRGYDLVVDVFGADHIATVPDVLAAVEALGYDKSKVKVVIYQFVTLTENGEQVKMSKRSGKSYTLDQLLEEVGADVVRFFLLMRGSGTHLEFDLALAKEQSDKNPVFYLQYAHARICSVFDKLKESGIAIVSDDKIDLTILKEERELDLIKNLAKFPEVIRASAEKCEPQILAEYLRETASLFHAFYHDCRIMGTEENLMQARLALADTARHVLRTGLETLGISAPEKM